MVSPVIDLSGFGTNTPVLQWWDWLFESVTSNWDWAFLQVTKDGTNWTTVCGLINGRIVPIVNKLLGLRSLL